MLACTLLQTGSIDITVFVSVWKHCLNVRLFLKSDDCDGSVLLLVCCIVRRSPLMPLYRLYLFVDDVKEMGLLTIHGHISNTRSPGSVKTNPSRKQSYFHCYLWHSGVCCVFCCLPLAHPRGNLPPKTSS